MSLKTRLERFITHKYTDIAVAALILVAIFEKHRTTLALTPIIKRLLKTAIVSLLFPMKK